MGPGNVGRCIAAIEATAKRLLQALQDELKLVPSQFQRM